VMAREIAPDAADGATFDLDLHPLQQAINTHLHVSP